MVRLCGMVPFFGFCWRIAAWDGLRSKDGTIIAYEFNEASGFSL